MKTNLLVLTGLLKSGNSRKIIMTLLTAVLFMTGQLVFAQDPAVQTQPANSQKPAPHLKQYLTEKYQIRDVISSLHQTPHGPEGSLNIIGPITPTAIVQGATGAERSRSAAKAFIAEETSLFGILDINELRESDMRSDEQGGSHIHYRRYLDDVPLEGMSITVHVGRDEKITSLEAQVVPVSPELSQAAKRETIAESAARTVVDHDLKSAGIDLKNVRVLKSEKVAIPSAPYIVWKMDVNVKKGIGRWLYTIDAFTGEMLEKRDALVSLR
jgi:fungalysin/thermolysin propeptide